MAAIVTQKQVLETILTDCANHYRGDPMAKLKSVHQKLKSSMSQLTRESRSLPENYYTKTKTLAADKEWPTALAAIEEACRTKPKGEHPLCRIRIRAAPHTKKGSGTYVSSVAACMHDYPFNEANKADASADADMLLTGPATEISFRYFYLHRWTLTNAPHLFEDDSPLLLLALVFQKAGTVETLLAVAGAKVTEKEMDDTTARSMGLYQQRSGIIGWAQAFEDLREAMRGRWHSNVVADYKGYGKPGSYMHASRQKKTPV
ncbi:hypothetical protein J4E81_000166 [Alternaria sp. BMP 2799]|nr:hypothetical protein J4E80_000374 [Alternaria sp. BMP 0032]KAI4705286.1 hypothetical protein J4E81_000166 [Alternaria sp. BMP 2799]KAI4711878.1 hypothetical protein J4E89_003321 [Alternaria sp. Ai002NY15]